MGLVYKCLSSIPVVFGSIVMKQSVLLVVEKSIFGSLIVDSTSENGA